MILAAAGSAAPASMPGIPSAEAFAAAAAYAQTILGWALLILGGSVIALLQKSYFRPESRNVRCVYLLFIAGWVFLARSIYFGTRVQSVYLALLFARKPDPLALREAVNSDLLDQIHNLEYALLVFGMWLAVYLGWWIFTRQSPTRQEG